MMVDVDLESVQNWKGAHTILPIILGSLSCKPYYFHITLPRQLPVHTLAGQDLSILVSKNQSGTESDFQNQNWNQIKRKEREKNQT
jgi:hypothetical protein